MASKSHSIVALAALALSAAPAVAEIQISIYGGYDWTADSEIELHEGGATRRFGGVRWDGVSFEMPPYWGARGIVWFDAMPGWGAGIDYAHAKVRAERGGVIGETFSRLEFTDGLNLLTANLFYRHLMAPGVMPYVGVGAGVSVPHVEATTARSTTYEYQLTGPTVQALVGLDVALTETISAFGEYKLNYSWNDASLRGGGRLSTDLATSQLILGVSYKFR